MKSRLIAHANGRWRQNCYVLGSESGQAVIIDPGSGADDIAAILGEHSWKPVAILNTHGHFDHIGAVADLMDRYGIPFLLHTLDENQLKHANLYRFAFESKDPIRVPVVSHSLEGDSGSLPVGPFTLTWFHTPGHTAGSVCFEFENMIFTGDTLLGRSAGRTDLPGGNAQDLRESLQKIAQRPEGTRMFGGHGRETTLGDALANCRNQSSA